MKNKSLFIIIFALFAGLLFVKKQYNINTLDEIYLADTYYKGDVNKDGKVNVKDYILIRKHILKTSTLKSDEQIRGDMNGDNKISSKDYIMIRKAIINHQFESVTTKPTATPRPKSTATPTPKPASTYTITFNANGGSVSQTSKTIKKGDKYGTLPTPTRSGYRFIGWFTDKDSKFDANYYSNKYSDLKTAFGNDYNSLLDHWFNYGYAEGRICSDNYRNSSSTYNNNGNETLYAAWEVFNSEWNYYTITYSSDIPLKGYINYNLTNGTNTTETFLLKASNNGTFRSYINYWVNGNIAKGMNSITFKDLNGNVVKPNYGISYIKTATGDELVNQHHYNTKNDYKSKTVFIGNSYLTLGVSIEWGGTITYLSGTSSTYNGGIVGKNIISTTDTGREIQDAFYGNLTFNGKQYCSGSCPNSISQYDPVQGGQGGSGNSQGSKVVDISIDDNNDTITVVSRPRLWAINNEDYKKTYGSEYNYSISDSYIYQTYHLVGNRIEYTHSYIDFTDNYSEFKNNCSKYGNAPYVVDPHAEAPVIYTTGDLWVAKYNDAVQNKNIFLTDSKQKKVTAFTSRYAGLYNTQGQGIGIYVKDLEKYVYKDNSGKYNYGQSQVYFHVNQMFYGSGAASLTSKDGETAILYMLYHTCEFDKAKEVKLPSSVIVLGSFQDLENYATSGKGGEWKQESGKWYYYRDGKKATGWQQIDWNGKISWYYFDSNGVMQVGWQHLDWNGLHWFYFDSNGAMLTNGWYNLSWNGKEDKYHFNESGVCDSKNC